jgi:hypothetical protein
MSFEISKLRDAFGPYLPSVISEVEKGELGLESDIVQALFDAVAAIEQQSLSWARLNQILHRASQAGMSEGFFRYYFLENPFQHPYPVTRVFGLKDYQPPRSNQLTSLEQLQWGLRRFIYDAMLYWGNFRQAYRDLRQRPFDEITKLFAAKKSDDNLLRRRGAVREPVPIAKDRRYLISEMACKTYEPARTVESSQHVQLAIKAFHALRAEDQIATPQALKAKTEELAKGQGQMALFELMYEDATSTLESQADVVALYSGQWNASQEARKSALENTRIYLSFCNDLDVYVATSMRSRQDFRDMGEICERIFRSDVLNKEYNVRYFDPTLSAATHHEDKGIVECLMVKTAKLLLYFAQHKESFGKVSECAMALSLGKPVIILCPDDQRGLELYHFYRDAHPLTRLVEFESGIVNGAMITHKVEEAITLIERIFSNRMEYDLAHKTGTAGYYLLKERLTGSTVRVITDDKLLTETFWNNWHGIA